MLPLWLATSQPQSFQGLGSVFILTYSLVFPLRSTCWGIWDLLGIITQWGVCLSALPIPLLVCSFKEINLKPPLMGIIGSKGKGPSKRTQDLPQQWLSTKAILPLISRSIEYSVTNVFPALSRWGQCHRSQDQQCAQQF